MAGHEGGAAAAPSSSDTAQAEASQGGVHPVHEVYENQRWLGLAWQAPIAVLDAPTWSDAAGNAVELPTPPSSGSGDWEVVVGPGTDASGWEYATVFNHLQYKRPGGRASQRFGDTCRRRLWRRVDRQAVGVAVPDENAAQTALTGAGGVPSVPSNALAAAHREAEVKKRAIRSFIAMIFDLVSRRKVWNLVPWDPAALFMLPKAHKRVYDELQAQALQRRLFTADTPPPPSLLREGGTLLQDMLCAAVHSRAAYGFAMQAGHISSVASYIRLHTLQPLSFDAVGGVSQEANNEAVAALTGIDPSDILLAHWRNSSFRPCHYVAIDRANCCVVVSIRGTLEIGDLLCDLAADPMEVHLMGVEGWVHQGILAAATYIHCTTQAALAEAARKCPGWPVLVTGHSLGGGVAALLCLLIKDSGGLPGLGPLRSITIGTAAVMSAPLAAACDEFTVSLILGADAVPHLSYASVEALLLEASEASPVRQVAQGLTKKLSSLGQFLGVGSGPLEATSTEAAIAATKEATEKRAGASGDGTGGSNSGKWSPVKSADMRLRESGAKPGFAEVRELARQTPRARQIPIIDLNEPGVQLPNETNGSEASAEQSKGAPGGRNGKEPMDGDDAPGSTTGTGGPGAPIGYVVEDSSAFSAGATDVLPYGFGPDAGLAAAAIAQEHSAPQTADAAQPGNPELLFPPGRLLWIFPAEESQEDDGGDEASGVEGGKLGSDVLDPEAERKLENAWDEAWEGRPSGGDAVNPAADSTAPVNADVPGAGAVNVAEATDAAARGEGGEGGSKARSVPAVVDADRATFERLLLLPDMLNDHLPDKYLEALKQL